MNFSPLMNEDTRLTCPFQTVTNISNAIQISQKLAEIFQLLYFKNFCAFLRDLPPTSVFCPHLVSFTIIIVRMIYIYINIYTRKVHNCRTKAADVLDKFLAGKHNANPLNILVHLQLLSLHSAYQFKVLFHLLPFGRNLNAEFGDPNFGGYGEFYKGWDLHQLKPHLRLPNVGPCLSAKFCSICRHLVAIPM